MSRYLLKRIALAIVTIWAVITITFFLMHSIPGNPFRSEKNAATGLSKSIEKYGLDKPRVEQYVIYLKNLLKGDLGDSMKSRVETVNDMVKRGFPVF